MEPKAIPINPVKSNHPFDGFRYALPILFTLHRQVARVLGERVGDAVAVGELLDRAVGVVAACNDAAVGNGPSPESLMITASELDGFATQIHYDLDYYVTLGLATQPTS